MKQVLNSTLITIWWYFEYTPIDSVARHVVVPHDKDPTLLQAFNIQSISYQKEKGLKDYAHRKSAYSSWTVYLPEELDIHTII